MFSEPSSTALYQNTLKRLDEVLMYKLSYFGIQSGELYRKTQSEYCTRRTAGSTAHRSNTPKKKTGHVLYTSANPPQRAPA